MRSRARFLIAILLAAGLGLWLAWTSIGGSLEHYVSPSGLRAGDGNTYRLNGLVGGGAGGYAALRAQSPGGLRFVVKDKTHPAERVDVLYRGTVPDTFRAGREVVVTGKLQGATFVAQRNGLTTLCPSKFQAKAAEAGGAPPKAKAPAGT